VTSLVSQRFSALLTVQAKEGRMFDFDATLPFNGSAVRR